MLTYESMLAEPEENIRKIAYFAGIRESESTLKSWRCLERLPLEWWVHAFLNRLTYLVCSTVWRVMPLRMGNRRIISNNVAEIFLQVILRFIASLHIRLGCCRCRLPQSFFTTYVQPACAHMVLDDVFNVLPTDASDLLAGCCLPYAISSLCWNLRRC